MIGSALESVATQETGSSTEHASAALRDEALAAVRTAREQLDAKSAAFDQALARLATSAVSAVDIPVNVACPELPSNPDLLALKLDALQHERQRLAETHTDAHPRVIDLDERIGQLERNAPRRQTVAVSSTRPKADPQRGEKARVAVQASEVERCREALSEARARWNEALDVVAFAPPGTDRPCWLPIKYSLASTPDVSPQASAALISAAWNDTAVIVGLAVAGLAYCVQVRRAELPANFTPTVEPDLPGASAESPLTRKRQLVTGRRAGTGAES
jgi:hypothetical protein